jgi:small acid-soluble spore protein A (major alpha-type SASP)
MLLLKLILSIVHAQNLCREWIAMSRNKLLVPGSENALNQMKEEIANEFGVQLGADTTARANGSVGGEMTKRLIRMAEQQLRS